MEMVMKLLDRSTIEKFAELHSLKMVVTERNLFNGNSYMKYYAIFEKCE